MIAIAVVNLKGGSAKSSTCYHLGGVLAKRGKRVLVVDDDPGFRRLAVRLLERAGLHATSEADTAKRARELVRDLRPAFVLLDVSLPDDDGVALAEELTQLPWRPRVVLISSDRDAASPARLDRSGAAAFISKDELTEIALRVAFGVA